MVELQWMTNDIEEDLTSIILMQAVKTEVKTEMINSQKAGIVCVCDFVYSMCVLSSLDKGSAALLLWVEMKLSL